MRSIDTAPGWEVFDAQPGAMRNADRVPVLDRGAPCARLAALAAPKAAAPLDNARIEPLTGAKGTLDEKEGVFKVSVPRSDFGPAGGRPPHAAPGPHLLGGVQARRDQTLVMGDMVLPEDQVNPVMSAALDTGSR